MCFLISDFEETKIVFEFYVTTPYLYDYFSLDDELLETEAAELSAATVIQHVADEVLIKESGKLVFLIKLLDQLKVEGHRCLVFSQSRKILDIMQKVLTNKVKFGP